MTKFPGKISAKYSNKNKALVYIIEQEMNNNLIEGFSADGFLKLMEINIVHPVTVKDDDRLYYTPSQKWKEYILDLVINKHYVDEDMIIDNTLDYFCILDKDMRKTMKVLTKLDFKKAKESIKGGKL